MPLYVVELKLVVNRHDDPPALMAKQGARMGEITDHIERTFAGHGTGLASVMSDVQARLTAYTAAEDKLLNPPEEERR